MPRSSDYPTRNQASLLNLDPSLHGEAPNKRITGRKGQGKGRGKHDFDGESEEKDKSGKSLPEDM